MYRNHCLDSWLYEAPYWNYITNMYINGNFFYRLDRRFKIYTHPTTRTKLIVDL